MRNRPTISVVLPTRNGSRYLDESIESIVAQTYEDWELIIVDDASTDDTRSKIASWVARDNRIRAVRLEENRKLPGALNEGFRQASGSFLAWTSDDNRYHPKAFARMLTVLENEPEISIVYADYTLIDAEGSPIKVHKVGTPEELATCNCIGACFLYRRAVHETLGGYDEGVFLAEDYDFWLRASTQFCAKPLHELLYFYRFHPGSLTSKHGQAVVLAREKVVTRWLSSTCHGQDTEVRALLSLACCALRHGVVGVARRHWIRAMLIARRPILNIGSRSLIVDLLFGSTVGASARYLWKHLMS